MALVPKLLSLTLLLLGGTLSLAAEKSHLPAGVVAEFGSSAFRAGGQVQGVTLSRDGKQLATWNAAGDIRLWDIATRRLVARVEGPQEHASYGWSPDGKRFFGVDRQGTIQLFESSSGETLPLKLEDVPRVHAAMITEDAVLLGCAGEVRALQSKDGKLQTTARFDKGETPWRLVLRRGEDLLDVYTSKQRRLTFEWPSGKLQSEARSAVPARFTTIQPAFDDQGTRVNFESGNAYLGLPEGGSDNLRTGQSNLSAGSISADGKLLATGDRDGHIKIWDRAAKSELLQLAPIGGGVGAIAMSVDGAIVAAGPSETDNRIRLWKIDRTGGTAKITSLVPDAGHSAGLRDIYFVEGKPWLISSGIDNTARIWDVHTQQELARLPRGYDCAASRDGKTLALHGLNGAPEVELYTTNDQGEANPLKKIAGSSSIGLSLDGKRLASIQRGGAASLVITDVFSGAEVKSFKLTTLSAYSMHWCEDAPLLACGETNNWVNVWNVETGETLLRNDKASPHTLTFSPDGKYLIAAARVFRAGEKSAIQVWNLTNQQLERSFGDARVMNLLVLDDNRRIVAGGLDGKLYVYDLESGKELGKLAAHQAGIYALAKSPDGKHFASGSIDSALWMWDAKVLPELK